MTVFIVAALLCLSLAACVIEPVGYGAPVYRYQSFYGDPYNGHHHGDWR